MKSIFTVFCLAACASYAAIAAPAPVKKLTPEQIKAKQEAFAKLSPEERQKAVEEGRAHFLERTGGYVRNTSGQKGRVLIANAQKAVPLDGVRKSVTKLAEQMKVAIDIEDVDGADAAKTASLLKDRKANAVIYILDTGKSPLLVSPDECWASVSVPALGDANAPSRLEKETMRALTFLCGGTASGYPNPMTYPVTDVRQLDLIEAPDLPIDVIQRMQMYLEKLGVTPYKQTTYRTACKQGWAPAPTNDVQKAIWNKVHEMPSEPIKIKPETRKVSE